MGRIEMYDMKYTKNKFKRKLKCSKGIRDNRGVLGSVTWRCEHSMQVGLQ